jgi:lipopolysaccharide/colanic/teichoic acid biosynthesis glycosyltransferase
MVNFHLVPTTMDVMVGKASVDSLDDLPLMQISYNIDRPSHLFSKRMFDIAFSGLLLITVYPIFLLSRAWAGKAHNDFLAAMPRIFSGELSVVGPQMTASRVSGNMADAPFLGKPGLIGMVQLQQSRKLSDEERNQYDLYYARNQSILLDLEILIKTWFRHRETKNKKNRN